MSKEIIRKAFVNKRTKQLSITIPKREFKRLNPTLKFSEDLFVRIRLARKRK